MVWTHYKGKQDKRGGIIQTALGAVFPCLWVVLHVRLTHLRWFLHWISDPLPIADLEVFRLVWWVSFKCNSTVRPLSEKHLIKTSVKCKAVALALNYAIVWILHFYYATLFAKSAGVFDLLAILYKSDIFGQRSKITQYHNNHLTFNNFRTVICDNNEIKSSGTK